MKKSDKRSAKLSAIALIAASVIAAMTLSSCGKTESGSDGDQNKNAATLYIYSFTSGFGDEWLSSLIKDYEEAKKDEIIGDKKGIHIQPTAIKSDVSGSQMANNNEVVYFLEQQDYYQLLNGNYIEDITEAITSVNPYDGQTLESKMFDDQKSYLGRVDADGNTHYYAYPHYFTQFGIVYDVALFNEKGYYFADGYDKNGDLSSMFLGKDGMKENWKKTVGPDGEPDTADDGLPSTYEEFFLLCDYIEGIGNDKSIVWSGQHRDAYLTHFINALAADYEGYDQMRLNFTFNGEATDLGTFVNGEFVKDANATTIDGTNGYELARQAGKYYAMDFYSTLFNKSYIKELFTNKETNFSSTFSHKNAQQYFLTGGSGGKKYAMLLDGSWWQTEATEVFNALSKIDAQYSKENRELGWMPLPKQSAGMSTKQTAYDIMYPLLLMKSGLNKDSWQYKYALDFIQFANSNEQLAKFTQITGCTKALKYDLTETQESKLSYFGKSFYNAYKNSDIVFPYDNNLMFANNQSTFKEIDNTGAGSPLYRSTAYSTYFTKGLENNVSAGTYFNGMYNYFKNDLKSIWKKAR